MVIEISQYSPLHVPNKHTQRQTETGFNSLFYGKSFPLDEWSTLPPPPKVSDRLYTGELLLIHCTQRDSNRCTRRRHTTEPAVPGENKQPRPIGIQRERDPETDPLHPPPAGAGGKPRPPVRMKKPSAEKDSDEYRHRRERNNLAVKKSRQRSKQKAVDTQQRVNELKEENERLEAKIKLLSKELSVLKDLFLEHAHNLADGGQAPANREGDSANGQ
ncbi:hypothetical protein NQZ68_040269 [Dissostichus eleginoides]|nr:hypothetical protein NQZ68_040269 [Dissostichus eleginoides]